MAKSDPRRAAGSAGSAATGSAATGSTATGSTATGSAADFLPERRTLSRLREAAAACRGCHLWTRGTQTVFGRGSGRASLLIVGEQPGDQEDLAGVPFVGPAGRLLDEALSEAGIPRSDVYVTNAVKHFKWERGEKGKRRIHRKPNAGEITACRPWLDAEISAVRPRIILALGATAAQALLGKKFRVTADRGRAITSELAESVVATVHPSSVLRAPTSAARAEARDGFVTDLRTVARMLDSHRTPSRRAGSTGSRQPRASSARSASSRRE
jgi:uracil-DNA glycosylase